MSFTLFGGDFAQPGSVIRSAAQFGFDELMTMLLDMLDPEPDTVTWSLTAEDEVAANSGINLYGDGEPDSVQVQAPSSVVQSGGFMTDRPATTPTSAGPRIVTIEHTFDSKHREHNIGLVVVVLELMRRASKQLRRRPKLRFQYGDHNFPVWLGEYTVRPTEGYWPGTRHPKRVQISVQCIEAFTHALQRADSRPPETSWIRLPAGHSFELIAALRYGDPDLGVLIRRTNPDMLEEDPGQLLRLLEPEHPAMQEPVIPRAPAFLERYAELTQAKAEARLGRQAASWSDFAAEVVIDESAPLIWE